MQKKFSLFIVLMLTVTLFAGCGNGGGTSPSPESSGPGNASTASVKTSPAESTGDGASVSGEVHKPDGYPTKNVTWIVPADAGAAIDIPTRALNDALSLGTNVVIENLAGASQTIGALEAATRPADGYTLLTGANAWGIIQPNMNELEYSPDDFRHIAMMTPAMPSFLTVRAESDIQNIDDWLALLDSGERFVYGVPNAGSYDHLAMVSMLMQLKSDAGVCMTYNGSSELLPAVLSGEVQVGVFNAADIIPRAESGEVRLIAVMSNEISHLAPDVPKITDYGVGKMETFMGLKWVAIRKDTPDEIVEWIKQELNRAIQSDAYQNYLVQAKFGTIREYSEEEITQIINTANQEYYAILKELGMSKDS